MFKLILLSFVVFSIAAVGSDSARQVYYQADSLMPANIVPTFENGHLVVYGVKSMSVYAPDGSLAYSIPVRENGYIPNVAVDTNRTAAAAVDLGVVEAEFRYSTKTDRRSVSLIPGGICHPSSASLPTTPFGARES